MKSIIIGVKVLAALALVSQAATAQYKQFNLVGDLVNLATQTDPRLKNPWGIAFVDDGPFYVTDTGSGLITANARNGQPLPLQIAVPAAKNQPPGTLGSPTGLVANETRDFVISKNGRSAPALLLVDTLDGLICGWNPKIDATHAIVVRDNSEALPYPASYTALTLSRNSKGHNILYAADSGGSLTTSNDQIAMLNGEFKPIGGFGDPLAPANMTVFGIQNIGREIYVTYAAFTELQGGVIDVFDVDGYFLQRFASNAPGGPLEEPWAFVEAPRGFGRFEDALLVGNWGDGRISAFDRKTGKLLGQLHGQNGTAITSGQGLWALISREDKLFFASGINNEADGLFGFILPIEEHGH